jgi:hypothetical protein
METSQTNYVSCKCQNCNGGIEFDASDFAKGETRAIECPHCHLETIIFVPVPITPPLSSINITAPRPKKTASPLTAIILWAITVILLFIGLGLGITSSNSDSDSAGVVLSIMTFFLIAAAIATGNYRTRKNPFKPPKLPKPKWICANCGTLSTLRQNACRACGQNSAIPLGTPRGGELFATYHGTVTAKERVEIEDEATKKLLRSLEPIPASSSITLELEKLAGLVRTGAITTDEWQRAKNLYLGQPKVTREDSLGRIQKLHDLCRSGALSESEFTMVKWDILSKKLDQIQK